MIGKPRRGAVEIHYDDDLAPFHCPHCGMEYAPDDSLCISCGFEYADEQHPYAIPLRRPAPVLDATGQLTADDLARLTRAVEALRATRGMEVVLAIFPETLQRPPEEIAWYYANTWEVGGISSHVDGPALPPQDPSKLILAALLEIVLLPWTIVKAIGLALIQSIRRPVPPSERGLLIAVFPHWQTITLEPTIAAADDWDFSDGRIQGLMATAAASMPAVGVVDAIEQLVTSL